MVKALLIAAAGMTGLSGCVGSDRSMATARGDASLAAAQMHRVIGADGEMSTQGIGLMPGELLVTAASSRRGSIGVDPKDILARSSSRIARAPEERDSKKNYVASYDKESKFLAAREVNSQFAPLPAAHTVPGDSSGSNMNISAASPTSVRLGEVEARANIEQRAQERRDIHFDSQVRRASNLICDGC